MLAQPNSFQPEETAPDFSQLFLDYIRDSVKAALDRIDPDPDVALADAERARALHVLSFSLKVSQAWPITYALLQVMNPKMERAGQWRDWFAVLQRAVAVGQSAQDSAALAYLMLQLGYLCTLMGDYGSATEWLVQSEQQFRCIDNPSLHALALIRLGNLARLQSQYTQAKQYITEALPLVDDDNDKHSRCYSVLGALARDQRDFPLAEKYSRQALDLRKGYQDQRAMAFCLSDLGESLRLQKSYDEAAQRYGEALEIYTHVHDSVRAAVTMMNLGIVYSLSNRPQEALEAYAKAEKVFLDIHDQTHLAMLYNNQGIEFLNLAQWNDAERAHQKSFHLWTALNKPDAMINVLDGLGLARMGKGAFKEAVEIFESAVTLLELLEDNSLMAYYDQKLMPHLKQARAELAERIGEAESDDISQDQMRKRA